MSDTVGDYLLERLRTWGIKRIYGYPGDGINGIIGAFSRLSDGEGPEFTQVRHEEMAAFMACAHAKFTGEVGVCLATSGPGAIHLLNGLYDAKLDHQPVVAIVGQQARAGIGGNYQQEVDLNSLFKDVAHEYVEVAMAPTQIRHLIDRAIRIALSERTVTAIIIPNDVQDADAVPQPPHTHGTVHSGPGYQPPRILPHDADLDRAAEILNAGERVAMLVGQGALHASEEVAQVADLLGAGVAKALLGKAVLSDELPYVTGSIGLLGTKPSSTMMQECDTLLMVGSSFPYSEFLPEEGDARGVQIDIDGKMIGIRYPMEVNLIGDSAETLRALMTRLQRKEDRSWREKIEGEVSEWWDLMEHRAELTADPINPQLVFHELSKRLPDGAIISSDSGSSANWYARDVKLRKGMLASLSGTLATMGPGVPYAIAAKFAYPIEACVRAGRRRRDADERNQRADHDRQVPPPVVRPAAGRARPQQPRPEPGDLGAARDGRGREIRGVAGSPRFPVRALRGAAWAEGHPRGHGRAGRRCLGRGAELGPTSRARGCDRSLGPAAAAPHHARAGQSAQLRSARRRS